MLSIQGELLAGARLLLMTTTEAYLKARARELEAYASAARDHHGVPDNIWHERYKLSQKMVALRGIIDVLEEA